VNGRSPGTPPGVQGPPPAAPAGASRDDARPPLPRIEPIGEILVAQGAVTREQLAQALDIQRQSGGRLGRVLVEMGVLGERQLARAVAQQVGLPYTELSEDAL